MSTKKKDNKKEVPINESQVKMALGIFGGIEGIQNIFNLITPHLDKGCRNLLDKKKEQYAEELGDDYNSIGFSYTAMGKNGVGFILMAHNFEDKDQPPKTSKPLEVMTTKQFLNSVLDAIKEQKDK